MRTLSSGEIAEHLGADRVLDPPGALPQRAASLDASAPVRPHELEIAVERLCLDSTSHRNLWDRAGGDAELMAARITEIVDERGKMHNPETDSGGILLGAAVAAGDAYDDPPEPGDPIVTLGSLTQTALRLECVTRLDPASPQVEVEGTAYLFHRAPWAPLPPDLPVERALELLDVCAVVAQTAELTPPGGHVCVLGAGNAGKLALAAARGAADKLTAVDADPEAVELVRSSGLCDIAVAADLRDPLAALDAVRAAGAPPAELTVVVVNATRCEPAALLLTREGGTVLLFSMATSFSAAALAADGIGISARMVVGSGYAPDRGALALELVRASRPLRRALGLEED